MNERSEEHLHKEVGLLVNINKDDEYIKQSLRSYGYEDLEIAAAIAQQRSSDLKTPLWRELLWPFLIGALLGLIFAAIDHVDREGGDGTFFLSVCFGAGIVYVMWGLAAIIRAVYIVVGFKVFVVFVYLVKIPKLYEIYLELEDDEQNKFQNGVLFIAIGLLCIFIIPLLLAAPALDPHDMVR